ncbi:cilia- and flagella-associated protein 77-like isoform X2 [Stylophora pistillata]|uniref:cilia- and flagella-associated protein 77-like isoform X2 n=1 Tax=Stylophora pistillata TaxID=50429 RepID=UPI000C04A768|nr:cilia- and flagella-associated protein 77-like isoform X2 [Stylophora pistillata]
MSKEYVTLGVQRESLINNPLLQKSELGRPLRRCFTLPPDGFTYGKPNEGKDSGAADGAVQTGLTTAQEHFQYRATHDMRRKDFGNEKTLSKVKRIPPTMVFGVPTKPSTPVYDLLGHKYQDRWIEERRKAEGAARARQEQKKHVDKTIYETRTVLLRKYQPPVDPSPPWHMKKFEKIPAYLSTFRSDQAKDSAFKHHATDSTSRQGVFGHGIYEPAKS